MAFDHHYYKGAAEAHEREVLELHRAATRVGRVEQWHAAVDHMKQLEERCAVLEGLLAEIRRMMHVNHLSDAMSVHFIQSHVDRIDAALAGKDGGK